MSMRIVATTILVTLVSASASVLAKELQHHEGGNASHNHGHEIHWGYAGKAGPEHWGELKEEFSTCNVGMRQSPIDVNAGVRIKTNLSNIKFDYKKVKGEVINNGHSIQVNYPAGSSINIDGEKYKLLQFHFHTPSENIVAGKHYDMEMHLVHENDKGELAVVAVFMKNGKHNKQLQSTWDIMPPKAGQKAMLTSAIFAGDLLPKDQTYTRFNGSLTTPPCSEGVSWFVMTNPIEVSEKQIAKFASVIGKDARPVQAINHRFVLGN